jgi:hypothetical protein
MSMSIYLKMLYSATFDHEKFSYIVTPLVFRNAKGVIFVMFTTLEEQVSAFKVRILCRPEIYD